MKVNWGKVILFAIFTVIMYYVLGLVIPADIAYKDILTLFLGAFVGGVIGEYIGEAGVPKKAITRADY